MCGAGGLRGRKRRQGTRCEGYCEAMLSAPWTALTPAPGDGHTRESVFLADNRGHLADMKHKQCHMFASIVRAMSLLCDIVAISKMMLPGRSLRYNR
jgi:hypothetical protein